MNSQLPGQLVLQGRTLAPGALARLRVGLVADELTTSCLQHTCQVQPVTPGNAWAVLALWRPDVLLVESCWQGHRERWRYGIAEYPLFPERNNLALQRVLDLARRLGVPAVFWNKEDGVHYERFIHSARLFDFILTVDERVLGRYRQDAPQARVGVLPFAVHRDLHYPASHPPRQRGALFVGSYTQTIHPERKYWQDLMFAACRPLGLTIVDRNSDRKSAIYRFPEADYIRVLPAIPHVHTGFYYRDYPVCLNVNTITDSRSMMSRRLMEILACGSLAVTNPSLAVATHLDGLCEVVTGPASAQQLFEQLSHGLTPQQQAMCREASAQVLARFGYERWLSQLMEFIG